MADPTHRHVVTKDALASPQLVQAINGINNCLPELPKRVRFERIVMARNLLMHTCAEHEGELAEHGPKARSSWPVAGEDSSTQSSVLESAGAHSLTSR